MFRQLKRVLAIRSRTNAVIQGISWGQEARPRTDERDRKRGMVLAERARFALGSGGRGYRTVSHR